MEVINAQTMYAMLTTPTLKSRIKAIDELIEAEAKKGKTNVTVTISSVKVYEYADIIKHFDDYGFLIKNEKCNDINAKNINISWGILDPRIKFENENDYLSSMDAFKMTISARKNAEGKDSLVYHLNRYLETFVIDLDFTINDTFLTNSVIDLVTTMELMKDAGYTVYFDQDNNCIKYSCDPNKKSIKQKDIYDIYEEYFKSIDIDFYYVFDTVFK